MDKQSNIFKDLIDKIPDGKLKLGNFFKIVGESGTAILVFIFALPNSIPNPIPGFSAITGIPLLYLAYRLMSGKEYTRLPKFLHEKEFNKEFYVGILKICIKALNFVEKFVKPRKSEKYTDAYDKFSGAVIFFLSCILCFPILFGNALPGLAIAVLALSVLEKDMAFFIIGNILAVLSVIWVSALVFGFLVGINLSLDYISNLFS
jgi:hypothetical protein